MSSASGSSKPDWALEREAGRAIVEKVASAPDLVALEVVGRRKIKVGEPYRFSFDIVVEPTSEFGKRGFVISPTPGAPSFEIYCDEGKVLGGEESGPSPLAYFTAGVAFCLMTHITGYLRFTDLKVQKLKLETRGNYVTSLGHVDRGGQGEGGCDSFETIVVVESDEPAERIAEFIEICEKACIASQTIAAAIPTSVGIVLNGERL